jgi:hypothetical protein
VNVTVLLSGHFLEVISSSDGLAEESGLFLHNVDKRICHKYEIPLHFVCVCLRPRVVEETEINEEINEQKRLSRQTT